MGFRYTHFLTRSNRFRVMREESAFSSLDRETYLGSSFFEFDSF